MNEFAPAGFTRRLAAMLYELLTVTALLLVAGLIFSVPLGFKGEGPLRHVFQPYLLAVVGAYFVWFWSRGRRTLAMKTWQLGIVDLAGQPLTPRRALLRYVAGLSAILVLPVLWALLDRDKQALYDRLAGTRLVRREM